MFFTIIWVLKGVWRVLWFGYDQYVFAAYRRVAASC